MFGLIGDVDDRRHRKADAQRIGLEFLRIEGDSHRQALAASFGYTSEDGRFDLSLFASHSETETPRAGQRDFAERDRRRAAEHATPDTYLSEYPHGNSITIQSPFSIDLETFEVVLNPPLVFKPELGGATLPSNRTFLPLGFSGRRAGRGAH